MSEQSVGVSVPIAASESVERKVYSRVTWRLMPVLFISYIIAYLDRVNVGFAKLQMIQELKLSDTVYGLGAGLFFIGYFFFEVPSNIILHRVGARVWIARIMVFWGIVSASTMFVTTAKGFYILRFLLGVAEAGFFPGIILYLTYWYPSYWRARMVAFLIAANPVSGLIGAPASGWIMQSLAGKYGWSGWQWLFVLEAVPAVLMGIFVFFYLDDRIQKAKWLSEEEKQILEKNIEAEAKDKQTHSLRQAFGSGMVWLMSFIYFCLLMGMYGVTFWLPTIIKATGVKSVLDVGLLTSIPFGVGVICMVLISRRSDATQERRWHCAIPSAICCISLILSTVFREKHYICGRGPKLGHGGPPATRSSGILGSFPLPFWAARRRPPESPWSIRSVNLSGFLGNYLVGWLTDLTHSTNAGLYVLATAAFLGAALVMVCVPSDLSTSSPRQFAINLA